jgi:dipeptidyl aminopeptidase/acylaminoacyl peptidase
MKNLYLFVLLSSVVVFSKTFGQRNGEIVNRAPVVFPQYSEVKDISWYYSSDEYGTAVSDKSISYEKITYLSDGLKVIGYLTTPRQPSEKKLPVVIFNRGSYIRNDIAFVHAPLFRMLVQNKFIVMAPALRGSEGGEGSDELGGKEISDILAIQEMLGSIPIADVDNVFMLGESRGGIMTFQAIRKNFPMRAAATVGAITNLEAYIQEQQWEDKILQNLWPDFAQRRKETLDSRSVIAWHDQIDVPILLLHGANDPQVKPTHALSLAQKLYESGKSFQVVILDGGNHILSQSAAEERDRQIVAWFKKHLKEN